MAEDCRNRCAFGAGSVDDASAIAMYYISFAVVAGCKRWLLVELHRRGNRCHVGGDRRHPSTK